LVWASVISGGKTMVVVIPLLIAAFLIAGLVQSLITNDLATRWLGSSSGWCGIAITCMAGGPYVYYPIAAVLLHAGAGLGVMVAFITAKNLWSLSRLPLEIALLGTHLTFVRVIVTLFLPPLLGILAEALFGKQVESIRKAMVV